MATDPAASAAPDLVVLAAGMGSRFGGLKQLTGVGPGGATLLEYSLYDARRAGFGRVIFVIRPEMQADFRAFAESRLPSSLPWTTCLQRLELPAGAPGAEERQKPWGTAHAVLAAEGSVSGSFAVVNADDFYGREAFESVATFLRTNRLDWSLVGYLLADTLSPAGGVNRGALHVTPTGALESIEEMLEISRADDGSIVGLGEAGPRILAEQQLVSMNFWAFNRSIFPDLHAGFNRFLARANLRRDEFPLPVAIQDVLEHGDRCVRVLAPRSRWFGITYHDDLPGVRDALERLVTAGMYPERLWS
ncbi:MAG TPA: NTP transferase domain-containing protein [Gemmatimonadales bacterium]|nr:NTP transferase domain-containing protein [Gemmatimonadales bacterium]